MFLIPFMLHLLLDLKLVVEDALGPENHGNGKTEGRRENLQFGELLLLRWGWARSSHIYKHRKLQLLHRKQMRRQPRAAIWEPRSTWQVKYVYMGEREAAGVRPGCSEEMRMLVFPLPWRVCFSFLQHWKVWLLTTLKYYIVTSFYNRCKTILK